MRSYHTLGAVALLSTIAAFQSYAGDDSKKEIVPTEPPAPSRWSLSMGATVSSIKTTFNPYPSDAALLDPGSTSIYNGGAPLFYINGVVGIGGPNNPTTNETGFAGSPFISSHEINADLTHYYATFLSSTVTQPGPFDDRDPSLGSYIKLAYDAFDLDANTVHISPFFQYAFTTAFDDGLSPVSATEVATTYSEPVRAHLQSPFAIYSSTIPGFSPTQGTIPLGGIGAVASSANIYMHTFTLGFDFTKDITDRVHLVLSTGPTLNLFDTGLSSVVLGTAGPISSRSDESKICFGWVGQLGVQVDLDSHKRWFIEGSGNYHWVTPFTVADTLTTAKVQASSWGASLGLGFRF